MGKQKDHVSVQGSVLWALNKPCEGDTETFGTGYVDSVAFRIWKKLSGRWPLASTGHPYKQLVMKENSF